MNEQTIRSLAFMQLEIFINKGKYVEQCKAEWYRRTLRSYPKWLDSPAEPLGQQDLLDYINSV